MDAELHQRGIGGSDVAAIFGIDDFGRDEFSVWAEKKGYRLEEDAPTLRMIVGKRLERGLLDIYNFVSGRVAEYSDVTRQHPERPWQVYTPDALVIGERRGVELKCVAPDQRRLWGETADDIPHRVTLQCYWYMAALDYDVWDVCSLIDLEPRIYTIERDREAEARMLERVSEWYAKYITGAERPPLGAGRAAARWLQHQYPVHRADIRPAGPDEIKLLDEYVDLRLAEKNLKKGRDEMETRIKAAIGDHEGLRWGDARFTWRRTKDKPVQDWEGLAWALLNNFIKDDGLRRKLLADYQSTKPGYRRIRLDHPKMREEKEEYGREYAAS